MANGKKKAKKAKKKTKSAKDEAATCRLPLVCAYLEKVAPPSGGSMPTPPPWFVDVQSCLGDLVLAVTRLEGNIHFSDTTETGPAYSVFYSPGGGGRPRRRRRPPIHR